MGCAAAYFLLRLGQGRLRVMVCEADPTYAASSTVRAAGGIRQTFCLPENILMSRFGVQFMRDAGAELAIDGAVPDVSFHRVPYLYLATGSAEVDRLRACLRVRESLGIPALWLDRDALGARFPWLNPDDVDAGLLGGEDEGVVDPEALLRALRSKAIAMGAVFVGARVTGLETDVGITAVRLESGERIACRHVVNAAGAGAAEVAALAGCEVPIVGREATTFVFRAPVALPDDAPIVVDRVQGLHFKAEGEVFLASLPAAGGDENLFESEIWPALALRVPAFEAIRFAGAWTGTIDASPFDGNPFIGPHPSLANFLCLAGFNGHGLQHAPAAGRAIAELIVYGEYRTIDLSRFGFERLSAPARMHEYY